MVDLRRGGPASHRARREVQRPRSRRRSKSHDEGSRPVSSRQGADRHGQGQPREERDGAGARARIHRDRARFGDRQVRDPRLPGRCRLRNRHSSDGSRRASQERRGDGIRSGNARARSTTPPGACRTRSACTRPSQRLISTCPSRWTRMPWISPTRRTQWARKGSGSRSWGARRRRSSALSRMRSVVTTSTERRSYPT